LKVFRKLKSVVRKVRERVDLVFAPERIEERRAIAPAATTTETFGEYVEGWLKRRVARGFRSEIDYRNALKNHLLPELGHRPLGDVTTKEIREVVGRLREKKAHRKTTLLAPRTVRGLYQSMHCVFESAVRDEIIQRNPCCLGADDLPDNEDSDPDFRETAIYTREELVEILDLDNKNDPPVPAYWRNLYRVLLFTGARVGEICALTWDRVDFEAKPLGRITIAKSYSSKRKQVGPTKTKVIRRAPIHPDLEPHIRWWRDVGYEQFTGMKPEPGALVFPAKGRGKNRGQLLPRGSTVVLHRLHDDLDALGMRPRRTHDLRRSFISLSNDVEGVNKDAIQRITHSRGGDVYAGYLEVEWKTTCRESSRMTLNEDDEAVPKDS
jgi:integrase